MHQTNSSTFSLGNRAVREIRNPKSEIRKKPEIRNPKKPSALPGTGPLRDIKPLKPANSPEPPRLELAPPPVAFGFRPSAFFRISDFGFRIS
jgi:hypothetical protein